MKIRLFALLSLLAAFPAFAQAPIDINSGNYIIDGCNPNRNKADPVLEGKYFMCVGAVNTALITLDKRDICPPPDITLDEAIRVAYQGMASEPGKLHVNYGILIAAALETTWPCK